MIRDLIHGTRDPYADVRPLPLPPDTQGWNGDHPILIDFYRQQQPETVIEVGSWKGLSALNAHRVISRPHEIICVDTWLGGLDHMLRHNEELPNLYRQFLSNVVWEQADDSITPLRQTSLIAARFLFHHRVTADAVYVDASHDYYDVAADLEMYWPLVKRGGWMLGDDYSDDWPDVKQAVDEFSRSRSDISVRRISSPFWFLSKL